MKSRGRGMLAAAVVAAAGGAVSWPGAARATRPEGIDVSQFQGAVDWATVHAPTGSGGGGKEFVFIRATRGGTTGVGSSGGLSGTGACRYDDPSFSGNIAGAKTAGMLAGPYHFARADRYNPADPTGLAGNLSSPEDEAKHFLQIAGSYMKPGYLRPVLDLESGDTNTTKAQLSDWAVRFMNTIVAAKGTGATPLIYVNTNFATNEVDSSVNIYDLWLARPNAASDSQNGDPITPGGFAHPYGVWGNGTPKPWKFWQYSQSGSLPGVPATVDLDVVHEEVAPLASFKVPGLIWTGAATATYQNINNWDALAEPTANDDVLFDTPIVAQGPTVVLDGNATARSVYFADNYTITGSAGTSLSLSVGHIDVDAGKTATISTALAGSSGFHKAGAGTLVITGGNGTMTGASTIAGGAVSIDTQSRLAPGIGSITIDNGATLRETNPGNGGSFVNAGIALIIGPSGLATVEYTTPNSASIYQGTITAIGGTTANGGSGTLVKTGPGEFRYQGPGTANTTFRRLIVQGGSFRLGNIPGANSETGLGAAPLGYLPDAITLDNGGAIGASYPLALNSNRGITLAANGGTLDGVFGALSVPAPIVGGGSLTVKGSVTLSGANTYTGNTSVGNSSNTTTLTISSPANLGDSANTIVFNQGTLRTMADMNLGRSITVNTGVGTFDTAGSAVAAGTVEGVGAFTKAGAGILAVTHLRLTPAPLGAGGGSVNVTGGTLQIGPSGGDAGGVSRINNLALLGGRLDLTDNKLITTGSLAQTTTQIQQGRNGGAWDGNTGIITALASGNVTTLGVASAAQVKGISSSQTATWAAQTVTGSDTLVMYTYGGDANLDGKINVDDYGRIDSNAPLGVAGWYNGDFNYDGKINVDDYGIIDFNIGIQGAPIFTASLPRAEGHVSGVPEPAALFIILPSGLFFSCRRRRR